MLGKGILVFFLCLYVEATCHSIPIGCNSTTDSIALSLAQSLQGITNALLVNSQTSCSGSTSTPCCPTEPSPLPTSCKEIKTKWPHSVSGYYLIGCNKGPKYVYCHMEELCNSGGGWTRMAHLDMSDSTEECPPGFRPYQIGGVQVCGRQSSSSGGCQSVKFPSCGISYTQVCGRVVGYKYATPDGIDQTRGTGHDDINSHYVDGVSLTHGFPRQHIWTFMAGYSENTPRLRVNCPCTNGTIQTVQSFIGNDYYCESGNPDDPLWDGEGCTPLERTCCQAPDLPWFHKVLNSTTTDYIELRVCGDQSTLDEDVPVNYYEIYVK